MGLVASGMFMAAIATTQASVFAQSLSLATVNRMDRSAFTEALGEIFENSPWVAEKAWEARPFDSLNELHAAMVDVARYAPIEQQVALLQAHPDLAGKEAQAGTLTDSSQVEQASAGLNALSKAELERLSQLNAAYRAKFGFPFIIAVRNHTKEGIFFEFERRLENETDVEFAKDLEQVYAITRLRLDKLFGIQ